MPEQQDHHKSKRTKYLHIHSCVPINGLDYSGHKDQYLSMRKKVIKRGTPRKTVTVAAPVFKDSGQESRPLKVLFDTGSDGDLFFVKRRHLRNYESHETAYPTTWGTSTGKFRTNMIAQLQLLLPEFSQNKMFSCEPDVKLVDDDASYSYDLIIGIGTLSAWRAKFDFDEHTMTIDDQTIPLRAPATFDDSKRVMNIYREAVEPHATKEETERVTHILDAKYEPADLPKVVEENCSHLTASHL